ncbi:tetratricopeptide repeat-containing sulfotransferase family protein [Haloferula sp.]|uniref:tetratricopeptide repeat-containing sulfotransferase family protein n=1 Tax=Haloferula sp. TaxID=2497595 RepID=UPI003C77A503
MGVLLELGRVLGLLQDFSQANRVFTRLLKISDRKNQPILLAKIAELSQDFVDQTVAGSAFARAATHGSVDLLAKYAEFELKHRNNEKARNLVERALEANPKYPYALLIKARLLREGGCASEALQLLENISDSGDIPSRVKAAYEKGQILDLLGDYDSAYNAFLEAKKPLMTYRQKAIHIRQLSRETFNEIAQCLTQRQVDRWRSEQLDRGGSSYNIALLGGHPRSGTTLLEQILMSHSAVNSTDETENFNIFAYSRVMNKTSERNALKAFDSLSNAAGARLRTDYLRAVRRSLVKEGDFEYWIDKNPSLTAIAPLLLRILPEIKFIVVNRDPRDVILSCFMQCFYPLDTIPANYLTLADAADEYCGVIRNWKTFAAFLGDSVCEVNYGDIVHDLPSVSRRVLSFMGLDWSPDVLRFNELSKDRIVRSKTAFDVTRNIHSNSIGRWKNYEKHFGPAIDKLIPVMD